MEAQSDPLFLKQVPLNLSLLTSDASAGHSSKERKQVAVTVQVSLSSKNSGRLKVLEIQLTDDQDPFFLYTLNIGEDDFHSLRSEQNLLVDFQQFPLKFIELLEECIRCKTEDAPRFVGKLTSDETGKYAALSIIETNSFKHITHLSLHFVPGNDTNVKKYLATLVKGFKSEIASLRHQLESTTLNLSGKLSDSENKATSLSLEVERLKISHTEQMTQCQIKASEELSREREKLMRELETERRNADREKRETELKYESEMKQLNQKYTTINTTHTHLLSHTQALETTLSNNNKQLDSLNKQVTTSRQEIMSLEQTIRSHERRVFELDQECRNTKEKLHQTEQLLHQKEESLAKANEAASFAGNSKVKAEETLEAYKTQHSFLEDSLKKASDEINKGNEIIRKLQAELKNSKSKIKLKNMVTLQQEKLLDERSATVDTLQKDLNHSKEALDKKIQELEAANNTISDLSKKLEESKQIIVDNNHVIEWLHKQLNDEAMSRPVVGSGVGYAGTIDFEKYAQAPHIPPTGTKSPTHYPRYTPASENIPPKVQTSRPATGSRVSPSTKPAYVPPNLASKSPSYPTQGHHAFKVSTSNMATGASHLSSHMTSHANTLGHPHPSSRYPLKSNTNVDNTAKSNYF